MVAGNNLVQKDEEVIRTFVAIDLNAENKLKMSLLISDLKNCQQQHPISWQKSEKLHVTIKFIGNTPRSKLTELIHSLTVAIANIEPFNIAFDKLHIFPSSKRPKVVALLVLAEEQLQNLKECIDNAALTMGFEKEQRAFRPHLTLGKNHSWSIPLLKWEIDALIAEQRVDHIILFQSITKEGATHYKELARLPLHSGDHTQ